MNWARGFFRVWVIFTFIWVLGFVFDAYNSVPFHPPQYVAMTSDGTINMVSDYGREADALNELVKREVLSRFESEGFPELTFFVKNSEKAKASALVDHAKKMKAEKLAEFRTEKMWNFLYFALGFPLALLLLGSAIGWALGGFKKTRNTD